MLLRNSISNTKKFFLKTVQNFKSFFSPGYQRLCKKAPQNNLSSSVAAASVMDDMNNNPTYKGLEKFYSDFTEKWDSEKDKATGRRRSKGKAVLSSSLAKQEKEAGNGKMNQMEKREESSDNQNNKRSLIDHQKGFNINSMGMTMTMREHRNNCMVEQKLRELEMLDMSNVEYVLDIEEVLHYYSRLTCPAYLEIVDKFFMELYSEFSVPVRSASTPRTHSVNSRLKLKRSVWC